MNTSEHSWSLKPFRGLSPRERQSQSEGSPASAVRQGQREADLKSLIHWVSRKKNKEVSFVKYFVVLQSLNNRNIVLDYFFMALFACHPL